MPWKHCQPALIALVTASDCGCGNSLRAARKSSRRSETACNASLISFSFLSRSSGLRIRLMFSIYSKPLKTFTSSGTSLA